MKTMLCAASILALLAAGCTYKSETTVQRPAPTTTIVTAEPPPPPPRTVIVPVQ
jgi:hypothetical protein